MQFPYLAALYIIETKIYKPKPAVPKKQVPTSIVPVHFDNKAIDYINLSRILRNKDIVKTLPSCLKETDTKLMVVFNLSQPIRSKLFNYKTFVNDLDVASFLQDETIYPCECHLSKFRNIDHGHVLTGNLQIVEYNKLRKLISKGPKYREPVAPNFEKARKCVKDGLVDCINKWTTKFKLAKEFFLEWCESTMVCVDAKIESVAGRIKLSSSRKVLSDPETVRHLKYLQEKYVMVPIDKAANNVAFVCKRYYAKVLLKEMGLINGISDTYNTITHISSTDCVSNETAKMKTLFNIDVPEAFQLLPVAYWMPKMHKSPVGSRFIIASKTCANKILSKHVTAAFRLFYDSLRVYHDKIRFFSGIKTFWVAQNNQPVIDSIVKINSKGNAKCVSTFDFATLYTKIPHDKLIDVLTKIVDFCFKGGTRIAIEINKLGVANWINSKKKNDLFTFSKATIVVAIKHLILNCYFCVGDKLLQQVIGIPMGIDPAPFWANLFLFHYESEWILKIKKTNNILARKFGNTFRFIDDLIAMNDGGVFGKHFKDIYPKELELKKENIGDQTASFLDIDVKIKNRVFETKLYDKRDNFSFSIVRLPHKCSNIPAKMFYSTIGAEFLRISRVTTSLEDMVCSVTSLLKRMYKQGADKENTIKVCNKMIVRYQPVFKKYNVTNQEIRKLIK